jgi:thioredoxin reductase (NADPH)
MVLASGAVYRGLGFASVVALGGAGVFFGGAGADANRVAGQDVYVLGGANSAGQAALHLARFARSVTLVARASSLEAGMSRYLVRQLHATPNVAARLGAEVVGGGGDGWLTHLVLRDRATGEEDTVEAQELFLAIGAHPRTNWLPEAIARDDHGFVLTGADVPAETWRLERDPYPLETSLPGVLAVGDVRHGSIKRVASAVGEGSVAVRVLHRLLDPADGSQPAGRIAESTA